jgi:ATP-binding cassette, subfamily B, bacterial
MFSSPTFKLVWRKVLLSWKTLTVIVALMLASSLVGLIPPLLVKELIDVAIPSAETGRIGWLLLAMVMVPLFGVAMSTGTISRFLSSSVPGDPSAA